MQWNGDAAKFLNKGLAAQLQELQGPPAVRVAAQRSHPGFLFHFRERPDQEHAALQHIKDFGFTDAFRLHIEDGGHFTWWYYRAGAFRRNLSSGREVGAAFAVYRDGRKVVDLWGGLRDGSTAQPWERDTLVTVFSATKLFPFLSSANAPDALRPVCDWFADSRIAVRAYGAFGLPTRGEFFAMGGYALYVWGSYIVTFALLTLEVVPLLKRKSETKA